MPKNMLISALSLTVVWIILSENASWQSALLGLVIAYASIDFSLRFLPVPAIKDIDLLALALYPFFILWQIYKAGISAIRLIIIGSVVTIAEIETELTNKFAITLLANSITLTPGTITLHTEGNKLIVFWLREPNAPKLEDEGEAIKGDLERKILTIQK